ncbi:MAG: hypothetical protein WBA93_02505 [Microcoleaceae cyanobacterium]
MQRGLGEAVRSWGFPKWSNCRGFPHERLHQDSVVCITVVINWYLNADCLL